MRIEQKWLNFHVSMTNSVAETRVTKIKINKNTNLGGTWTGGHAMRVALTASFCIMTRFFTGVGFFEQKVEI